VAAAIAWINLRQTMVDLPVFPEHEANTARKSAQAMGLQAAECRHEAPARCD
jgi:hypothetical protein